MTDDSKEPARNCGMCTRTSCAVAAGAPCVVGVKLLVKAVLELAIHDLRTRTPAPVADAVSVGTRRGRPLHIGRDRWSTAYALLSGHSRGPGGVSMLKFMEDQLDNIDLRAVIKTGVLEGKNQCHLDRKYNNPTGSQTRRRRGTSAS